MQSEKALVGSIVDETKEDLNDEFDELASLIMEATEDGWLPSRTLMYIADIREMCEREERFARAAEGISTVMDYVYDSEPEAPTEAESRHLLYKLGTAQSKLYELDELCSPV